MRIFFDTEFLEGTGVMPELLAIGLVRGDGATYYAENGDVNLARANEWVQANVVPHLTGPVKTKQQIAREVRAFIGNDPELWAYFCTYDHMLLLDLLGGWMQTPEPARVCHDLETLFVIGQFTAERMPKQEGAAHHAMNDALWVKGAFEYMQEEF